MSHDVILTAKMHAEVLAYVRAGAYGHVAAEAAGIPAAVFRRWLACSSTTDADTPLASFRADLRKAAAQARARAEIEVHQKRPLMWLKHGPGRERPRRPGWTNPVRPRNLPTRERSSNWLHSSEGQQTIEALLTALTPHPEARVVAGSVFGRLATETLSPSSE